MERFVLPDTPLPTPWQKEAYEKLRGSKQARRAKFAKTPAETEMEALFRENLKSEQELFAKKVLGPRRSFEGANTKPRIYYRRKSIASCFRAPTTFAKFAAAQLKRDCVVCSLKQPPQTPRFDNHIKLCRAPATPPLIKFLKPTTAPFAISRSRCVRSCSKIWRLL